MSSVPRMPLHDDGCEDAMGLYKAAQVALAGVMAERASLMKQHSQLHHSNANDWPFGCASRLALVSVTKSSKADVPY